VLKYKTLASELYERSLSARVFEITHWMQYDLVLGYKLSPRAVPPNNASGMLQLQEQSLTHIRVCIECLRH
jgi:hypothetical protein